MHEDGISAANTAVNEESALNNAGTTTEVEPGLACSVHFKCTIRLEKLRNESEVGK